MPAYCMPTKEVIKYFDLDIEFLKSITIIDDNVSWLVIVINNEDGYLTISIITSTDVANKIINTCEEDSLIGIKGKIDADKNGLIIKEAKYHF